VFKRGPMYHRHNKNHPDVRQETLPGDCFLENTQNQLWILAIVIVISVVYAIASFSAGDAVDFATQPAVSESIRIQSVALTRCPYCPGFLDSRGTCNIRDCPLYSANWGKAQAAGIPVKQVLIKPLALEAAALQGKSSVIVHAVYAGGRAQRAGLQIGDSIQRFNGHKVKNLKHFKSIVARARPESDVKINIIRNGQKIKSTIRIGEGEMEGVTIP